MLLGNITRIASNPIYFSGYFGTNERSQLGLNSSNGLLKYGSLNQNNGIPSGYGGGYSWSLPIKSNGLAVRIKNGTTITRAQLALGINIVSNNISPNPLKGSGYLLTATLQIVILLQANSPSIKGIGSISKALLGSTISLSSHIYGVGRINTANLGSIIWLQGIIRGNGGVNTAILNQLVHMSAHVYVNEGSASVQQMVDGIWLALANKYVDPITMGGLINVLSTGGVNYTTLANAVLDALANDHDVDGSIAKLLKELHEIRGLQFGNSVVINKVTSKQSTDNIILDISESPTTTIITRE